MPEVDQRVNHSATRPLIVLTKRSKNKTVIRTHQNTFICLISNYVTTITNNKELSKRKKKKKKIEIKITIQNISQAN